MALAMEIDVATGEMESMTEVTVHFSDYGDAVRVIIGINAEEVAAGIALDSWRDFEPTLTWMARGDTDPGPFPLYAAVEMGDGSIVHISADEPIRIEGYPSYTVVDSTRSSFNGFSDNWASYYYLAPDGHSQNGFYPLSVHYTDNYAWTDDSRWTLDTPERINGQVTVLAMLTYAKWQTNHAVSEVSLLNTKAHFNLDLSGVDLKGGDVSFWVTTDLGRWHWVGFVSDGDNVVTLNADDATQSWSRNKNPIGSEALDIDAVQSWGIAFNSFTEEPTGILKMDEFYFEKLGTSGANVIENGGLYYIVDGLEGDDVLTGFSGSDKLIGGVGNDRLFGEGGEDVLDGGDGNDVLFGAAGADQLLGGNGIDWVSYVTSAGGVTASLLAGGLSGEAAGDMFQSIEGLEGSIFADALIGDGVNNYLYGNAGNDWLEGLAGADRLTGGDGDDTLLGGDDADELIGGDGVDLVVYNRSAEGVDVNLALNRGIGGEAQGDTFDSIEDIVGTFYGDRLTGNAEKNFIYGLDGDDMLWGHAGDDILIGGVGADILTGGAGIDATSYHNSNSAVRVVLFDRLGRFGDAEGDRFGSIENIIGSPFDDEIFGDNAANELYGQQGADNLYGHTGNDMLDGGTGDDRLYGQDGNDLLIGAQGQDRLYGGAGADRFFFRAVGDSPTGTPDEIVDFTRAHGDKIDLSFIDANVNTGGDQAFSFIGAAAFSSTAGELRYAGNLLEADVNGDGTADFQVQLNVASLQSSDFFL